MVRVVDKVKPGMKRTGKLLRLKVEAKLTLGRYLHTRK